MAKRQNRPEDFTLPLVDLFMPPHLADGATVEFCEWVEKLKRYGAPLQFVNAHALLWGIKTICIYENGRFLDWLGSLRREQCTVGYVELSLVLTFARNYLFMEAVANIAMLTTLTFSVISWAIVYHADMQVYCNLLPTLIALHFALFVSLTPFYRTATRGLWPVVLHVAQWPMLFGIIILLGLMPESEYFLYLLNVKANIFHSWEIHQETSLRFILSLYLNKAFLCMALLPVVHTIIRLYVSHSVGVRSPARAVLVQEVLNEHSGKYGWYIPHAGDDSYSNLLPTTLPAREVVKRWLITDADIAAACAAAVKETLQEMGIGGGAP